MQVFLKALSGTFHGKIMAEVSVLIFGLSSYVIVGIILQFTPNGIWKHSTEVGEGEVDSVEEGVGKLSPGSEGSLLVCVLGVGGRHVSNQGHQGQQTRKGVADVQWQGVVKKMLQSRSCPYKTSSFQPRPQSRNLPGSLSPVLHEPTLATETAQGPF